MITCSNYGDPKFLKVFETMYNMNPHKKFNTFDVLRYTKPSNDKLEENEFTFRLMTRQYNVPYDLDMFNCEHETIIQEHEMKQSDWSMNRFVKRTMYKHRFYPTGGCTNELPFTSKYIINIHKYDNKCLLWCLLAYLHPAKYHPNRVRNYKNTRVY